MSMSAVDVAAHTLRFRLVTRLSQTPSSDRSTRSMLYDQLLSISELLGLSVESLDDDPEPPDLHKSLFDSLWADYERNPINHNRDPKIIALRASDYGLDISAARKLRHSSYPYPKWLGTKPMRSLATGTIVRVHLFEAIDS